MLKHTLAPFSALALFALPVFAKDTVKQAGKNDVATEYRLRENGEFFRQVGKHLCSIGDNVRDFRISRHPNDVFVAYFEKDNNLYGLYNGNRFDSCPKVDSMLLMSAVKRFTVNTESASNVTLLALSHRGNFLVRTGEKVAVVVNNVKEYVMNTECFNEENRNYNSYIAFAINENNHVAKIKGIELGDSKFDQSGSYSSLKEFKEEQNVCSGRPMTHGELLLKLLGQ